MGDAADDGARLIFHVFLSSQLALESEATKQVMGWIATGAVQVMQLVGGGGTAELIVLNRKIGDKMAPLQQRMADVLKEQANVIGKTQEVDVEIRDIEETTTKDDVKKSLEKVIDNDLVVAARRAYGETQIALVRLPAEVTWKVIGERGKIRIGLVKCSIREINQPLECFRCWHPGHVARQCKSDIHRTDLCIKCGKSDNKIADCTNEAHCVICAETNSEKHCKDVADSRRCAVFQEAYKRKTTKRQ